MKIPTSQILRGILGTAAMLVASCASDLDTTRVPMSSASSSHDGSLVNRLDASITSWRVAHGKPRIARHKALDRMAQAHCDFMARNRGNFSLGSENISHYGFEERAMMAQRGYGMESLAENVAGGYLGGDIPGGLVTAWVESQKHVYNLRQDWDATGIGVHVAEDGMVYATQIFATRNHSMMAVSRNLMQH